MPLFGRKPKPPSSELPPGEEVERSVYARMIQGKQEMDGTLHFTNRRLLFEAKRGEARWMSVPFDEVREVALYPAPGHTMGMPGSRSQCLFVETTAAEQIWWDFGEREEREWLPLVQARVAAAAPASEDA
jgi:hypothetical protein